MNMNTPAKIVILGGGPIGLEAALYARFLGYDVELLERNEICSSLLADHAVQFRAPLNELATPLGLAALESHGVDFDSADDDKSGTEFAKEYCVPLSQTDLLRKTVRLGCLVKRVEVVNAADGEEVDEFDVEDDGAEGENESIVTPRFRIEFVDSTGNPEQVLNVAANFVLDATGHDVGTTCQIWSGTTLKRCDRTGAYLAASSNFDVGDDFSSAKDLQTGEKHAYVIGRKSFGNDKPIGNRFTLRHGHDQIRTVFSMIGARDDLDLYASIRPQA